MNIIERLRGLGSQKPKRMPADQPNRAGVINNPLPDIPWLGSERLANPNLDTGTEGRGQWRELQEALIDPKAAACLDLRCQVVSDLSWSLVARPGTTPEVLATVRRALEGLNLVEDFEELAKAAYFGITPVEVRWEVRKGLLLPSELDSFEPMHLSFGPDRQPWVDGVAPEPGSLILHRHGSHFRNPWGLGRGRTIPRWARVKTAIAFSTYRDYPRYSHDRMVLHYPDGTADEEQGRYIAIANKLIDSPGLVLPDGMDADRLQLDSKFDVGARLLDAADAQIAVGILGNTLTTSEGQHGTQALGSVHESQSQRTESADGRRVESTFNRTLIPWIVALNHGPEAVPPLFVFSRQVRAALKDRLEAMLAGQRAGVKVSEVWFRETFGIPAPQDDSDVLEAPVAPQEPALPPAGTAPGALLSLTALDPMDGMFQRWTDAYVQRQGAISRLAAQVVAEAHDYAPALEGVLGLGRDFPTSAAEWLQDALRAGAQAGAWEADREVAAMALDVAPEIDYELTPALALRWLEGKVPMTIRQVDGLKDAELRARAFWVAGVDQMNTLQALQRAMADALAKGTPFADFKTTWLPRLQQSGVNDARLRVAFQLQLHGAYMGGRMASLQANPAVVNLTYVTAGDESVRPEHAIFDGVTLPKDHVFWFTHIPPLGFNCRCRVRASSTEERVTPAQDPRLNTPPDTGFGEGAQAFNRYLDALAARPMPVFTPLEPTRAGWDWLQATRPASPLPAPGTVEASQPAAGNLVADPTGRVIAAPGADAQTLGAIQAPAEIWLTPMESPEGLLGLEIGYLQPLGNDLVLRVPVRAGLVSRAQGPQILTATTLQPYRQGVKLK